MQIARSINPSCNVQPERTEVLRIEPPKDETSRDIHPDVTSLHSGLEQHPSIIQECVPVMGLWTLAHRWVAGTSWDLGYSAYPGLRVSGFRDNPTETKY